MISLRKALSKWLYPDAHKDAESLWYLRLKLGEARDWLGHDFPDVDVAIYWAMVSERNHFRTLTAPYIYPVPENEMVHSIGELREHLRGKKASLRDGAPTP